MIALSLLLGMPQFATPDDRLIEFSQKDNRVMVHLQELCYGIGARPTGSPELRKAEEWALKKFKQFGYKTAHLEKWGDIPVGFQRGPNNWAKMIAPSQAKMVFTTNCWTPGTDGPKKGNVVMMPTSLDDVASRKGQLKGSWVLHNATVGMRGANLTKEDPKLRQAVVDCGILGFLYGTPGENVWTHGTWKDKTYENRPKTVEVQLRKDNWQGLADSVAGRQGDGRRDQRRQPMDQRADSGPQRRRGDSWKPETG